MPTLGAHLSIAGGLPRAVERAVVTRCEALQIFTKSVGQWRARVLPDAEVAAFRSGVERAALRPVVAHASYLINVAAAAPALREQSTAALAEELERAERLGLDGLVLHPGAYTSGSEQEGLRLVAEALAPLVRRPGRTRLLLEHTAGQGTSLGCRFEHLASILKMLDGAPRVGVCLDTCHLLAAGYDIGSALGYEDTFRAFERQIGLDRLGLFHLNDSKKPCGSRVDRHEHIGKGCIGIEPFARILNDPRFAHLGMVIETAKQRTEGSGAVAADPCDRRNLRTLRRLIRAEPKA